LVNTLMLIKPNIVEMNTAGDVIAALEDGGIVIRNMRTELFTRERAEGFYEEHRGEWFFERLITFMTSGPVMALIVEHEDCVEYVRDFIGATDPAEAVPGTIRARFGDELPRNAVHASDTPENAKREMAFMFGNEAVT
jgi:nucleoside-diphosphate kinase